MMTDPSVVIIDHPQGKLLKDDADIQDATVLNDLLWPELSYSGGGKEHGFALYMSPAAFMESDPAQADLYLFHDAQDDPCDGLVSDTVMFDVSPIMALYRRQYGHRENIWLNLHVDADSAPTRILYRCWEGWDRWSDPAANC